MEEVSLLGLVFDQDAVAPRLKESVEDFGHPRVVDVAPLWIDRFERGEDRIEAGVADDGLIRPGCTRGKRVADRLRGVPLLDVAHEVLERRTICFGGISLHDRGEGLEHTPVHHRPFGSGQRVLATYEEVVRLHIFEIREPLQEFDLLSAPVGDE